MDNKEAINWLTRIRDRLMTTSSKQFEALTFAIAALEQREKAFDEWCTDCKEYDHNRNCCPRYNRVIRGAVDEVKQQGWIPCSERLPSAQPEQRYTEEELRVFQHGISLSLLSKRSSQHWQYDEDTATEIKFLERLYEKVVADMRGEQDGRFNQQTGGD